jgi:4-hydroxybenzoate polyprenyltransferase
MRVHHYIKNLLVFAALGCSGQFFQPKKLVVAVAGFLAFCMVSSVVYIINDIRDKEKDRRHPVKCKRPIASGEVSEKEAWILVIGLLLFAILNNSLVFEIGPTILLLLYLILNLAYSWKLKNIPLVDVTILVAGFWIRVVYGAWITHIQISNWLYLTVIAIAFYFALGKRRNELQQIGSGETRKVLKSYPIHFLDKSMNMCLTLANVAYALWSMDEKTVSFYHNKYLVFTVPIVLLISMKYSLNVEGRSDGDPVEVLVHDKVLILLCLLYFAGMFTILYIM